VGNIRSALAGDYAMSCGSMDTLGNWYIICTNWRSDLTFLLQVNLGKDKITQLPMPEVSGVQEIRLMAPGNSSFAAWPSPFHSRVEFTWTPYQTGGDFLFRIFDPAGRLVQDFGRIPNNAKRVLVWNPAGVPSGHYLAVAKNGQRVWTRKITRK
jgi:hypothetical protein